jgi:putative Mn2+ efflux pump MntP
MALIMGGFQALMPVIGYYFTDSILVYIYSYADIIAFIIFTLLGLKFIIEAIYGSNECEVCKVCFKNLILMGIATSIDALAAGVNLRLTSANLLLSVCIIGAVSFLMSQGGFWLGNYFGGPAEKMKPQKTDKRQHCPALCSKTQLEISFGVQAMELCIFVQMNQIIRRGFCVCINQ